jgi:hypothetical protein
MATGKISQVTEFKKFVGFSLYPVILKIFDVRVSNQVSFPGTPAWRGGYPF